MFLFHVLDYLEEFTRKKSYCFLAFMGYRGMLGFPERFWTYHYRIIGLRWISWNVSVCVEGL